MLMASCRRPLDQAWSKLTHCLPMLCPGLRSVVLPWILINGWRATPRRRPSPRRSRSFSRAWLIMSTETSSMRSDQSWNKSRVDRPKLLTSSPQTWWLKSHPRLRRSSYYWFRPKPQTIVFVTPSMPPRHCSTPSKTCADCYKGAPWKQV